MSTDAEQILRDAARRVMAKGYHLEPGAYGVGWNAKRGRWSPMKGRGMRMCPIGATVVVTQPECPVIAMANRFETRQIQTGSVPAAAAKALGVDLSWVIDFSLAFDGIVVLDTEGGRLGAALRSEAMSKVP